MPQDLVRQAGENIKRLRTSKGITQEELAEALGVGRSTVTQWEQGRAFPRSRPLEKLTKFFNVSRSEIVGESSTYKDITPTITTPLHEYKVETIDLELLLNHPDNKLMFGNKILTTDEKKRVKQMLITMFPESVES